DPRREIRSILGEGAEPAHHRQEARHVRRRPPRRELVEHAPRYLVELVEDDLATHDWAHLKETRVPGLPQPGQSAARGMSQPQRAASCYRLPYVNDCAHVVFWTSALPGKSPDWDTRVNSALRRRCLFCKAWRPAGARDEGQWLILSVKDVPSSL